MKCPSCPDFDLVVSTRKGVEIDYCPNCKGVWLDHGELERILIRTFPQHQKHNDQSKMPHEKSYDVKKSNPKAARSSFLEDLFNIAD